MNFVYIQVLASTCKEVFGRIQKGVRSEVDVIGNYV